MLSIMRVFAVKYTAPWIQFESVLIAFQVTMHMNHWRGVCKCAPRSLVLNQVAVASLKCGRNSLLLIGALAPTFVCILPSINPEFQVTSRANRYGKHNLFERRVLSRETNDWAFLLYSKLAQQSQWQYRKTWRDNRILICILQNIEWIDHYVFNPPVAPVPDIHTSMFVVVWWYGRAGTLGHEHTFYCTSFTWEVMRFFPLRVCLKYRTSLHF